MSHKKSKKLHPDIGQRVRWKYFGESGTGILLAVDCSVGLILHLVQRDGGEGWTLEKADTYLWYKEARAQGVKNGTKHCYWVQFYTLLKLCPRCKLCKDSANVLCRFCNPHENCKFHLACRARRMDEAAELWKFLKKEK